MGSFDPHKCAICLAPFVDGEDDVQVFVKTKKGQETLKSISKLKNDGKFSSLDSHHIYNIPVHDKCRKRYYLKDRELKHFSDTSAPQPNLVSIKAEEDSQHSEDKYDAETGFDYQGLCFFCGEDASDKFRNEEMVKPPDERIYSKIRYVHSNSPSLVYRATVWGEEVQERVKDKDLIGLKARYHEDCSIMYSAARKKKPAPKVRAPTFGDKVKANLAKDIIGASSFVEMMKDNIKKEIFEGSDMLAEDNMNQETGGQKEEFDYEKHCVICEKDTSTDSIRGPVFYITRPTTAEILLKILAVRPSDEYGEKVRKRVEDRDLVSLSARCHKWCYLHFNIRDNEPDQLAALEAEANINRYYEDYILPEDAGDFDYACQCIICGRDASEQTESEIRVIQRSYTRENLLDASFQYSDKWREQVRKRLIDKDLVSLGARYHKACFPQFFLPPPENLLPVVRAETGLICRQLEEDILVLTVRKRVLDKDLVSLGARYHKACFPQFFLPPPENLLPVVRLETGLICRQFEEDILSDMVEGEGGDSATQFEFKSFCFVCGEDASDEYMINVKKRPAEKRRYISIRIPPKPDTIASLRSALSSSDNVWSRVISNRLKGFTDEELIVKGLRYHHNCGEHILRSNFKPVRRPGRPTRADMMANGLQDWRDIVDEENQDTDGTEPQDTAGKEHEVLIKVEDGDELHSVLHVEGIQTDTGFNYKKRCLFCGEDASDIFIARQENLPVGERTQVRDVITRTLTEKISLLAIVWGEEVLERVDGKNLVSLQARYHVPCYALYAPAIPNKDFKTPVQKKHKSKFELRSDVPEDTEFDYSTQCIICGNTTDPSEADVRLVQRPDTGEHLVNASYRVSDKWRDQVRKRVIDKDLVSLGARYHKACFPQFFMPPPAPPKQAEKDDVWYDVPIEKRVKKSRKSKNKTSLSKGSDDTVKHQEDTTQDIQDTTDDWADSFQDDFDFDDGQDTYQEKCAGKEDDPKTLEDFNLEDDSDVKKEVEKLREVIQRGSEDLCHSCLSPGRSLQPLLQYTELFNMLTGSQKKTILVCMGCFEEIKRIDAFKEMATKAQRFLGKVQHSEKPTKPQIEPVFIELPGCDETAKSDNEHPDDDLFDDHNASDGPSDVGEKEAVKESSRVSTRSYCKKHKIYIDEKKKVKAKKIKKTVERESSESDSDFGSDDIEKSDATSAGKKSIKTNILFMTKHDSDPDYDPPDFIKESEVSVKKKTCKKQRAGDRCKITYGKDSIVDIVKKIKIDPKDVDVWMRREKSSLYFRKLNDKCILCVSKLPDDQSLAQHLELLHKKTPNSQTCPYCKIVFKCESTLSKHMQHHYVVLRCSLCGYQCYGKHNMLLHLTQHKRSYECLECGRQFEYSEDFYAHYKQLHKFFQCDECGQKLWSRGLLQKHIKRHHTVIQCLECNITFRSAGSKYNHMKTKHEIERTEESYCVTCGIQFDNKYLFKRHIEMSKVHREERNELTSITCGECGKVLSRNNYKYHYKAFHSKEEKVYIPCPICCKLLVSKRKLKTHIMNVHERVPKRRDKICQYCGRGFAVRKILNNHIRTHTGEKPFKCPHCDATFAQTAAVYTHIKCRHKEAFQSRNKDCNATGNINSQTDDTTGIINSQTDDATGTINSQTDVATGSINSQTDDATGNLNSQTDDATGTFDSQIEDLIAAGTGTTSGHNVFG